MKVNNMNDKILKLIEGRLKEGERKYGHENVKTDGRDFTTEALEEILDCCVYVTAKLITIKESEMERPIDDEEPMSNCCYAVFSHPGWPDSDICSSCFEHADIWEEEDG